MNGFNANQNILISVLMPAYNAEKYIAEAIESILNQTYKNFEFIIIDDGSADNTASIIQAFAEKDKRVVFVRNKENLKICKSLNRCIKIAKGRYIARMDADDWSYSDRLEKQIKFMQGNPNIVISGVTMEICDEKMKVLSRRKYHLTDKEIRKKLFRYSPFCHPAVIYKTKFARKINGYDINLYDAEDYDFYFRLGLYGEFANLPDTLLKLRTGKHSVSQLRPRRQENLTLHIRKKAVNDYGYKMNFIDHLFYLGRQFSLLLPNKIRIWLFNKIRNE